MLYPDLLDIIRNGENSGVEFKRDDITPEELAKEFVAFANFRGGIVLLGVDDQGEISGLKRHNTEEWIMDTVFHHYVTPSIIPFYEEVTTPDGVVAVIKIEQGIQKPYAVRKRDRDEVFIRIGSISRKADRDQLLRMSQESGFYHFESAPVSGSGVDDLDISLFIALYSKSFGDDLSKSGKNAISLRLSQLDMLVESSYQGTVCTVAGIVLFGKAPSRLLPQHGIRVIHYRGNTEEIDSISDHSFTLPVGRIYNEEANLLEKSGLADVVMNHLTEKLSWEAIATDGLTRTRSWKYPRSVLREVIINAIIHRDYTRKGKNEIRLFNDRIEVESQGRLPNTLTVEKIKAGQKYPRNPILVQFAQYLGLMEHKGLGIRKIVLNELKVSGFPPPDFIETDDTFTVIIKQKPETH